MTVRELAPTLKVMKTHFKSSLTPSSAHVARFAVLTLAFLVATAAPVRAKADPMREFVLSCSYGVLAGTLVGAASLAFTDKPGDNLNRVARGASIGLYTGILLGLYVVYGVPSEDESMVAGLEDPAGLEAAASDARSVASVASDAIVWPPRLAVFPLVGERGVEGGAVQLNVLNF